MDSGSFVLSRRKLKFDYARSLCRAQYMDLATMYEEGEYAAVRALCANHTVAPSNCWIGFQRGTLNDNEWEWVQDVPSSVVAVNELINIDLWSLTPWQWSRADVYCQALSNVTISYAQDGSNYGANSSFQFTINKALHFAVTDVVWESTVRFEVYTHSAALPGLKCTVHFEDDLYSTSAADYVFWSIEDFGAAATASDDIVTAYTTVDHDQSAPSTIEESAEWIWNTVYLNKTFVARDEALTFEFAFEHVDGVQNVPGDDCASISYFAPHKWKTAHCDTEFYFVCNAKDHRPSFTESDDGKFAVLTDRTLTRNEAESLCQNVYGYGLATTYSFYEHTQIAALLSANGLDDDGAWIGLRYDEELYSDSNNLGNGFGWDTESDFIFDDWTFAVWGSGWSSDSAFPEPADNAKCVVQSGSEWDLADCNTTAFAVCNVGAHSPSFSASQLGSFYLLEDQLQNYVNGAQMCRDYVSLRSEGAVIYHPIENERALWLCSNSTNGRGCFIGFNNLPTAYYDDATMRWRNGAKVDELAPPWFGNPWLFRQSDTALNDYIDGKFNGTDDGDTNYCAAIVQDGDGGQWGWDVVDCDSELNMLCDGGDDHAQCWMLQNCAQCAVRRDCGWCGGRCQLTDEVCYADDGEEMIEQEFGCTDYEPVVNITYHADFNYTFTVNITMCASTAPYSVATEQLFEFVNYSNCVVQNEVVEVFITSNWTEAMRGNYDILGKVVSLHQTTSDVDRDHYDNFTSFDEQTVCDVVVRHGWARQITCDNRGVGEQDNVTQFDMLHDMLRNLLPRLEQRLFDG